MTPTPEGKQLAADLANALEPGMHFNPAEFDEGSRAPVNRALARLATEHLALKAELAEEKAFWAAKWGNVATRIDALKAKHEDALADLREIDRIAVYGLWKDCCDAREDVSTIAAKWRVETDPLVEALDFAGIKISARGVATVRAELSKRGYEIGRKS